MGARRSSHRRHGRDARYGISRNGASGGRKARTQGTLEIRDAFFLAPLAFSDPSQAQPLAMAAAAGAVDSGGDAADQPLAGFSEQELEKIAMLLEETDELNESFE